MVKKGTKRPDIVIFRITTLAQTAIEYTNQGYVDDLQYYQGEESIFKAQQIASNMPTAKGEELVNLVLRSNATMEEGSASWGGYREGAGRPSTGRKRKFYYVTDQEDVEIKKLLQQLREG